MKNLKRKYLIILIALCIIALVAVLLIVMPKIQLFINPDVTFEPVVRPDVATPTPAPTLDPNKDYVVIYVGNMIYDVVPLGETKLITVNQSNGAINDVSITAEGVHMAHSTCENQDCVQQGEITVDNSKTRVLMNWIVCLPNQVSIELILREAK